MKSFLAGVLSCMVIGGSGFVVFLQWHQNTSQTDSQDELAKSAQALPPVYLCPMHPEITSHEHGQSCSICGMDLVLAEQEQTSAAQTTLPEGHASIELSSYRQQLIGLKVGQVEKKNLFRTIKAPARAAFDPELYTAQAEYQQALQQLNRVKNSPLKSVRRNVERMVSSSKVRLKVLGLSDSQIAAIDRNTNISESLLITKKGGKVWIYADIFEMDLRNIAKGQAVKISANYLEGLTITGTVASTDQVINPITRTAKVRIEVTASPVKLRPESYLDVEIYVPQGEHLAIPLDAVVDTGRETFVFVKEDQGRLIPKPVTLKFRADDHYAVAAGLNEGEHIVVSGNFLIDSESQLKGALQRMRQDDQDS